MNSRTLNDSASAPTDDTADRARRGPHPLVALAAFLGLVAGAMTVAVLLVTLARLLQNAV